MKKVNLSLSFMLFTAVLLLGVGDVWANPGVSTRHEAFRMPPKLVPRVKFWIDVFTIYGKNHAVLHHRDHPQVVFRVLDFGTEASLMPAVTLERYRKKKIKESVAEIRRALGVLAKGKPALTALELHIESQMKFIPSRTKKYKTVVSEKLIRSQTGIREKYADSLRRSGRYMHIIEEIFTREFNLPIELTRLPFIESSFDYKAYSRVGAAGIWQFMPRTARIYSMKINSQLDERRDVIQATRGAAKYLRDAYKSLNKWPLAVTSYNHGVAGVKRKIKKMGTTNIADIVEHPTKRVFGFASNNFYPEFLAALEIYENYLWYFPGLELEQPLRIAQYKLPHSISVAHVAKKTRIDIEELKKLNYALTSNVWKGRYRVPKGYSLKVPREYAARLLELRIPEPVGATASSVYGGITYRVRKGDTLGRIAGKFNTTVAKIKRLNGLTSNMVYVGQTLAVREREGKKSPSASSPKVVKVNAPSGYTVRRGDSLYKIARRYGMTVSELMSRNNLKSSRIKPGQKLVIEGASGSSNVQPSSGKTYTVRKGDSLWSISRKFGISLTSLKKANGMRRNTIKPGQKITVP